MQLDRRRRRRAVFSVKVGKRAYGNLAIYEARDRQLHVYHRAFPGHYSDNDLRRNIEDAALRYYSDMFPLSGKQDLNS